MAHYLTCSESRIRTFCDTCNKEVDGIATFEKKEGMYFTVVLACHKTKAGIKITKELLKNSRISGLILKAKGTIEPVVAQNRTEKILTPDFLRLEEAVRTAKEKVYNKLYGTGRWIETEDYDELIIPGVTEKRRRIEMED